jgi:hypothetical protein
MSSTIVNQKGRRMSSSNRSIVMIKETNMTETMKQFAIDCAFYAMNRYQVEREVASYIKVQFCQLALYII